MRETDPHHRGKRGSLLNHEEGDRTQFGTVGRNVPEDNIEHTI